MLIKETKYSYNDVMVVPAKVSSIEHRSECNPFHKDGFLPIFTAPMSTVVNELNYQLFEDNHIHAIMPRNISYDVRLEYALNNKWAAFSLKEFEDFFCDEGYVKNYMKNRKKVLIDVANGHMKKLFVTVKKAKRLYGETLQIMIGNIANPFTYEEVFKCGADYVRLGVGAGNACITSSNTSIHYPMASLVEETFKIKEHIAQERGIPMCDMPKIIADGGIRNYSDVIKALALGADYVMIGSVLAQLVESAATTFGFKNENEYTIFNPFQDKITETEGVFLVEEDETNKEIYIGELFKIFYGMASKKGQIDICGEKTKTSEGIVKKIPCSTNMHKWVNNMIDYLRSAMSYTDINSVYQMNKVNLILISDKTYQSVNK